MAVDTSESFIKNRATEFVPGPSLRAGRSITKSVVLDKFGFSYDNARNNSIKIKCAAGETIKIIHKDNGGKCHIGVPSFDGKIYVFVHFSTPSPGSVNYGFSDKVIYIHDVETPDLLACNGADLVFVCLDHDESISVRNINGSEEALEEVEAPPFAISARCWTLSTRDIPKNSVLKYGISGKNNSGASIFIAETSANNSVPWWNLHGVKPLDGRWRICLNSKISCHAASRSDDNKKVPSFSGDVVYINGIEQPRLLSFCGDTPDWVAFENDKEIGTFVIYQDANNNININRDESYLSFNCNKIIEDPYDPYGQDRINFEATRLNYYGSKDAGSGETIHISRNGWSFESICGVRPYQSGFVEYIHFENSGSYIVSCEDFGYSGFFFHIHVSEQNPTIESVVKSGYAPVIEKIKKSGVSIWVNGEAIDAPANAYRTLNIDKEYLESLSGERLQSLVSEKVSAFIYNNKMISSDLVCVKIDKSVISNSDIIFVNNAIHGALNTRSIKYAYDYSLLDYNKINLLERAGAEFFFDMSESLITKYPSSLVEGGMVYIDSRVSDFESRIKETLTAKASMVIVGGSSESIGRTLNIVNSFMHPSFNGVYNYYCRRKVSFSEQIDVISLADSINGNFKKDTVYSTPYAGLEIFGKVSNFATKGSLSCFLLPNGEWKFPYARYSNWHFSDEILRDVQDAIFKVESDFNIRIGFAIHSKSIQENEKDFKAICTKSGVYSIMIIDAAYISDSEIIEMHKRLSSDGFQVYLEGNPHLVTSGMLSSSFCLGNWVWLSEYRGRIPPYLRGIVREI